MAVKTPALLASQIGMQHEIDIRNEHLVLLLFTIANKYRQISAAARSKARVCSRSFFGKTGSNPAGSIS